MLAKRVGLRGAEGKEAAQQLEGVRGEGAAVVVAAQEWREMRLATPLQEAPAPGPTWWLGGAGVVIHSLVGARPNRSFVGQPTRSLPISDFSTLNFILVGPRHIMVGEVIVNCLFVRRFKTQMHGLELTNKGRRSDLLLQVLQNLEQRRRAAMAQLFCIKI